MPLAYALEVARVTMKSTLGTDSILESGAEILQKICEKVEVRTGLSDSSNPLTF